MKNSVKLLHCADLHIGCERAALGNRSKTRKAEVKKTFRRIIELCRQESVELLLIAGDLFEDNHVPQETLQEVRDAMASIPDTIIAVAPGNHDPATPDSPYLLEHFWPDNVLLFTAQFQVAELEQLGVRLYGAGFTGAYCYQPLLRAAGTEDADWIHITVLHGDLVADNARSDYNAVTIRQLTNSKMDYVALGHIHKRSEILRAGNTYYAYSGCPEGQGFDETGAKGVYLGTVSSGSCQLGFVPLCKRRYTALSVEATGLSGTQEITGAVRAAMQRENGADYAEDIYRVVLTGQTEGGYIKPEEIEAELEDIWYLRIKDRTTAKIDMEELVGENSLRGVFAKKMMEQKGTVPEECRELALQLGLKAFYSELEVRY